MAHVKRNIEKLEQKQENKTDKYDLMKYISSSLLAGVLFDRYQNANSSERKRILSKIANVFNGQTKLNTFIEDEGISIEGEEAKKYIEKVNTYIGEISLNERPTNVEHLLTEDDKIEAFGNIGKEIISDVQNKKEEVK